MKVLGVFRDVWRFWKVLNRYPKLKRSTSDVHDLHSDVELVLSPDSLNPYFDCNIKKEEKRRSIFIIGRHWISERLSDETDESESSSGCSSLQSSDLEQPFRGRASTEGNILTRPRRWRYPPPGSIISHQTRVERRMSISMRGSNASY